MSCGTCQEHVQDRAHARPDHHGVKALLIAAYGIVVGLSIYVHVGLGWSPWTLVPALVVLAHAVVFGVIALVVGRLQRGGAGHSHAPDGHTHPTALLQRPRLYDTFVRIATLGGETRFRRRVLGLARLKPGDAVLDVGCATGTLLLLAAPIVGATGTLHGIEPSRPMVEYAMAKAKARGVNLNVGLGSADRLPFADASFDAVLCTLVLHHLPEEDRAPALAEMRRVLRPGGRLVVADVQRPRAVSALFSIVSIAHLRVPHRLLDMTELSVLLERAGFGGIERQAGSGAIGIIAAVRA